MCMLRFLRKPYLGTRLVASTVTAPLPFNALMHFTRVGNHNVMKVLQTTPTCSLMPNM